MRVLHAVCACGQRPCVCLHVAASRACEPVIDTVGHSTRVAQGVYFEISDEVNASGRACATSNLMVFKLVSTEGGHAGLDASRSQGNEQQPHHGQSSVGTAQHRHSVSISACVHLFVFRSHEPNERSTHMCKVMSSGVPSLLRSVMSWMALTAMMICPSV